MQALSKINLYLKVTGKRPDGYHELRTLFWPLRNPADEVTCRFSAGVFELECDDPSIPSGGGNLAGKAALLYAEAAGISPEWHVEIRKRIPAAAGMGGGSSDAAAVLTILNGTYGRFTGGELAEMALRLGADVPYFLNPRAGFATGVGEKLEPFEFELPELPVVVVNPKFPLSTKWSYEHMRADRIGEEDGGRGKRLEEGLRRGDLEEVGENLYNDLAEAAYEKFPILGEIRRYMLSSGALGVEITGSGPTLYGIAPDVEGLKRKLESWNETLSVYA